MPCQLCEVFHLDKTGNEEGRFFSVFGPKSKSRRQRRKCLCKSQRISWQYHESIVCVIRNCVNLESFWTQWRLKMAECWRGHVASRDFTQFGSIWEILGALPSVILLKVRNLLGVSRVPGGLTRQMPMAEANMSQTRGSYKLNSSAKCMHTMHKYTHLNTQLPLVNFWTGSAMFYDRCYSRYFLIAPVPQTFFHGRIRRIYLKTNPSMHWQRKRKIEINEIHPSPTNNMI